MKSIQKLPMVLYEYFIELSLLQVSYVKSYYNSNIDKDILVDCKHHTISESTEICLSRALHKVKKSK